MKTHTQEIENEYETIQYRTRPVKPILGGFLVGSVIGVATALFTTISRLRKFPVTRRSTINM